MLRSTIAIVFLCSLTFEAGLVAIAQEPLKVLLSPGVTQVEAAAAVRTLQADGSVELPSILNALREAPSESRNWLLSLAQSIADRNPEAARPVLRSLVEAPNENADARYWAVDFLTRGHPSAREGMLDKMINDPCLELRYEAIDQRLARLKQAGEAMSADQRVKALGELLNAARLPAQTQDIAKQLEELGTKTDLLRHFGFVAQWQVVGPFENSGQSGFDVGYEPEKQYAQGALRFQEELAGKEKQVAWRKASTASADGAVDLNAVFDHAKGAVVYAHTEIRSPKELACEIRVGTPNAIKVWVNGTQVVGREVYHTGWQLDQYVASVRLNSGVNTVMLKVCQNEQTEDWAQDFLFALRFCDETGFRVDLATE